MKAGDAITLFQDEDSPKDWYLTKDKDGFPLRATGDIKALFFNNSAIANKVLDSLDCPIKSIAFKVATEPIKEGKQLLYAILTASYKKEEN